MKTLLRTIAAQIGPPIRAIPSSAGERPTKEIWRAFKEARNALKKHFGGDIWLRHSGYSRHPGESEDSEPTSSTSGRRKWRVLEYLWDFSFSRFKIPEAIEQKGARPIVNGKFRLLLVAESELGTATEICRDLLKLQEAQAPIRCLIYPKPKRPAQHSALQQRMVRVMKSHELFVTPQEGWLFVALGRNSEPTTCDFFTLADDLSALVPLGELNVANPS